MAFNIFGADKNGFHTKPSNIRYGCVILIKFDVDTFKFISPINAGNRKSFGMMKCRGLNNV